MTKHEALAIVASLCADGVLDEKEEAILRKSLAQPQRKPLTEWQPIEQAYPQDKPIDILMGDGSILCAVLPQFDGDLWWNGAGTGEKFIDPKYANVTHWRIHGEHITPPQRKPLDWEPIREFWRNNSGINWDELEAAIKVAHGIKENT